MRTVGLGVGLGVGGAADLVGRVGCLPVRIRVGVKSAISLFRVGQGSVLIAFKMGNSSFGSSNTLFRFCTSLCQRFSS